MAAANSNKKPLTSKSINALKPGQSLSDSGENTVWTFLAIRNASKLFSIATDHPSTIK